MTTSPLHLERTHWTRAEVVAGLDEAGRGAWAGPVVAAAVILPPDPYRLLEVLAGVDDSKQLTPAKRARLNERIGEVAEVALGVIPAAVVDAEGIIAATMQAMELALAGLSQRPDFLLIDHIPYPLGHWAQERLVRGESQSLSIAAASIAAKVHRDGLMVALDEQYPGYGFAQHKGYGTSDHRAAIGQLGPTPIHRRSWAPFLQLRLPFEVAP